MGNHFELPPKVKRVDALRETDSSEEDSVWDLAKKEDEARAMLTKKGLPKKSADEVADYISDETLEKIEAEKLSLIDPLTGLGNRRALQKVAAAVLKLDDRPAGAEEKRKAGFTEKRKAHNAFILFDLDHFKKINDTYGHPAGDQVLVEIPRAVEKVLRKNESLYRIGGEEFVVLLPDTDSFSALKAAERIRETIGNLVIKIKDDQEIKVTASLGCSCTDQLPDNLPQKKYLEALTKNADAAAYRAKAGGRNRVVMFEAGMEGEENK